MLISELIAELQQAQSDYGDHKVYVNDHDVSQVKARGSKDGIISFAETGPVKPEDVNEIDLDFF